MFDNYSLKARYYPVVILFFPIVIIGIFYSFQFDSIIHLLTSVGVVGAFTYLFSQLGRDQGKLKESALWNGWGGSPTIQILRFRNACLDQHTKQRYHNKLQAFCPIRSVPDMVMEANDPEGADEVYKAWTKYLIAQTRDTKKFSLLLKDNISYGFRRNLWGLKPVAIAITFVLLVGNYLFWWYRLKTSSPLLFPQSFYYSSIGLLIMLLFWLFIVSEKWVKITAFSYAERLFECIEAL